MLRTSIIFCCARLIIENRSILLGKTTVSGGGVGEASSEAVPKRSPFLASGQAPGLGSSEGSGFLLLALGGGLLSPISPLGRKPPWIGGPDP